MVTDSEVERRTKDLHEDYRKRFLTNILPSLPTLPNGMKLMGVNEQSPLIDSGEIFKLRVFRPDRPYKTSEVFDDGCALRYINYSRLVNDDIMVSKECLEGLT